MPPRRRRGAGDAPSAGPGDRGINLLDVAPDGRILRRYGGEGGDGGEACPPTTSILARTLRAALLPAGFPASVTPDYAAFPAGDAVQGLCS